MANEIITTQEFREKIRYISASTLEAFASKELEPSPEMVEQLAKEIENWALNAQAE